MSQSNSNLFSKLTEILSETAGAASGVKKEIEIIITKGKISFIYMLSHCPKF